MGIGWAGFRLDLVRTEERDDVNIKIGDVDDAFEKVLNISKLNHTLINGIFTFPSVSCI